MLFSELSTNAPVSIIKKRYSHNQYLKWQKLNITGPFKRTIIPPGSIILSILAMKSVCCFAPLRKLFCNGIWSREYIRALMKHAAGKGKCAFFCAGESFFKLATLGFI